MYTLVPFVKLASLWTIKNSNSNSNALDFVCSTKEVDNSLDFLSMSNLSTENQIMNIVNFSLLLPNELLTAMIIAFQLSGW